MLTANFLEMMAKKIELIINRNLGPGNYNFYLMFLNRDDATGQIKIKSVSDLGDNDLATRLEYAAEYLKKETGPASCDTVH